MSRAALLCSLLLLAACPPSSGGPADGGATLVKTVDVGGLVLFVKGAPQLRTQFGFGLLSPRTGSHPPCSSRHRRAWRPHTSSCRLPLLPPGQARPRVGRTGGLKLIARPSAP